MICPPPKNLSIMPYPLPCLLLYLHKAVSEQYLLKKYDEYQRVLSSKRRKIHAGLILCPSPSLQREIDIDLLVWDKEGPRKEYHHVA